MQRLISWQFIKALNFLNDFNEVLYNENFKNKTTFYFKIVQTLEARISSYKKIPATGRLNLEMNMFDRMIRVVTSNVNNVIKQLEDPEKWTI